MKLLSLTLLSTGIVFLTFVYYTSKTLESSKKRVFIYYNKPYKTGSSSITSWLKWIAIDNEMNCEGPGIGTHKGDEKIDHWFESVDWSKVDCIIQHHEMTTKRWRILMNAVSDRNQIFITSVRPSRERIISWVNEVLAQFTKLESVDQNPGFEHLLRQIMLLFDGDALYRYYCEDMKCDWHWLSKRFDYVINLWADNEDGDTGCERIVDKMRQYGLYVKNDAPNHIRNRRNASIAYENVFKTIDIKNELNKEDRFSSFLLRHVRPRESLSWL